MFLYSGTYSQPGYAGLLNVKDPGNTAGYRIHERDLIPWEKSFELTVKNGDATLEGETLGLPEITKLMSRVWYYEWTE